jgi:hypothetical protein
LEAAGENMIYDAITVLWIIDNGFVRSGVDTLAMSMEYIQSCYKKLMGILLLKASQMLCVSPDKMQQF